MHLKYATRFGYGETIASDEQGGGAFKVFGSNGPYASCARSNTSAPVIIVGRKGSYGKVNWSDEPCFASDTTFFIDKTTSTNNHLRWLFYLLQTLGLDEGTGEAAIPGLNRENAYTKEILLPSLEHQIVIADFLDSETAHIDLLLAAKENLLNLLAEKRSALITTAVTRGIIPKVRLKDSGIPWLGEVPEHWEVERSKWLFKERDIRSEFGDEEMLTVSHLTGVTTRAEKNVNMFMAESQEGSKICEVGDLVINTLWAWMGAMGVSPQHGIVSPAYNVYEPCNRLDTAYLDYLVRIPVFAQEAIRYSKGVWSSRLRLYPEGLYEIWFPVPPVQEQRVIVEHLRTRISQLDALKEVTERTIALLRERRTALIASAVTGKLEIGVRDAN